MESLYAIRDAFFWWAGVWATVTFVNRAVRKALNRRGRGEYAQWRREFVGFLFSADARPDGAEIGKLEEAETNAEPHTVTEETPYEQ